MTGRGTSWEQEATKRNFSPKWIHSVAVVEASLLGSGVPESSLLEQPDGNFSATQFPPGRLLLAGGKRPPDVRTRRQHSTPGRRPVQRYDLGLCEPPQA